MKLVRILFLLLLAARILCVLITPARADLPPKESQALRAIAKSCVDRERKIEDFVRRNSGNRPGNASMASEAFSLLSRPSILPAAYWAIRDDSLKLPIRDIVSARYFSAIDGRLAQTEFSCAGQSDKHAWKLLSEKMASGKDAAQFRKQFAPAWKNWVLQQIKQRMSYSQYTNIIETAKLLSKRRLLNLPKPLIESRRKIDAQILGSTPPMKIAPQLSSNRDPKWLTWGRMTQKRAQNERDFLPSAQRLLADLAK
jgi:hypothetical protein